LASGNKALRESETATCIEAGATYRQSVVFRCCHPERSERCRFAAATAKT
jgi:hypothetical protein